LAELKQRMEMTLRGEGFELAELEAVVGLLAGPGVIQRFDFGGFILLRQEGLSRYAAAVAREVQKHPQGLDCIREHELLAGSTLRWIADGRFQISDACRARTGKPGTAKHANQAKCTLLRRGRHAQLIEQERQLVGLLVDAFRERSADAVSGGGAGAQQHRQAGGRRGLQGGRKLA
jgi:hypothetical protein